PPRSPAAPPAPPQRPARARTAHVLDHRGLVGPGGLVPIEHRADDLRADLRAALIPTLDRGANQAPLTLQQLRRGVPLDPEAGVPADQHRPLTEEPLS